MLIFIAYQGLDEVSEHVRGVVHAMSRNERAVNFQNIRAGLFNWAHCGRKFEEVQGRHQANRHSGDR